MSTPILLFNSHQYHHQPNPRDRYLTALAEVKAAEEQYVAYAHAHEKALQRQREEEIHRHIVLALQQQHKEAVRGQRLFDVLEQETSLTGGYPERYYFGTPEADIYEELAARKALSRMNYPHQGALLNRRRLALLQEHREQAKARALALARHRGEEQTRLSRLSGEGDLKSILNLLFESGATTRGAPSRADLQHRFVPAAPPYQGCGSHCASDREPCHSNVKAGSDGDEIEQFMNLLLGRQVAAEPKEKEKAQAESEPQGCSCATPPSAPAANPNSTPAPTPNTSTSNLAEASTIPVTIPSLLSHLQSRFSRETEPEVTETLQSLFASLGPASANLQRTPRVEKRKSTDNSPTREQSSGASGLSLKEQLEARLRKDPNVEVHDTVQAMLASLATANGAQTSAPLPSGSGSGPETVVESGSATDGKDKGKGIACDVPKVMSHEPHTPTSKDVSDSMSVVHSIEADFNTLRTDFSFPIHLDFTPPSSAPSSPHASDSESTLTSKLAYTANNSPVRYYEQALNVLLGKLDEVESWGNEEVRKERKAVVGRVKSALEDVEREVQERFVQRKAREVGRIITTENDGFKVEGTPLAPVPVVHEDAVEGPVAGPEFASEALGSSDAVSPIAAVIEGQMAFTSSESTTEESSVTEEYTLDASEATITPFVDMVNTETPPLAETLVTLASREALGEEAISVQQPSHPPTGPYSYPLTPSLPIAQPDSEPLDTFLLPATSPIISKRPNVTEDADELVVVDKDHGEGSEWSEVEA